MFSITVNLIANTNAIVRESRGGTRNFLKAPLHILWKQFRTKNAHMFAIRAR